MSCTGSNRPLTYVVLVILIALWAIVLVPPYLKDRRASSGSFRAMQNGSLPPASTAQRFLPLQHAAGGSASTPTALAGPAVTPLGGNGKVVPLHPLVVDEPSLGFGPSTEPDPLTEALHAPRTVALGAPVSMADARERRRQVLMGLSGLAFASLLLAVFVGGLWVPIHVLFDLTLVGYGILLVRRRQLSTEAMSKIAPIRPPVTEVAPMTLQSAPSYLLRSGT